MVTSLTLEESSSAVALAFLLNSIVLLRFEGMLMVIDGKNLYSVACPGGGTSRGDPSLRRLAIDIIELSMVKSCKDESGG